VETQNEKIGIIEQLSLDGAIQAPAGWADLMEGARGGKSKDGPDLIVWGSSTLTSVLLEQGLVDGVLLLVYPVLQGQANASFRTAPTRERIDSRER